MAHKETQRQNTIDEIKGFARQQLEKGGPAGISMSAIARLMEISAPALYRYFDSRDDLIRALIGDACEDFVNALKSAANRMSTEGFAQRYWAVTMEYRDWALAHSSDFHLIFNNPESIDKLSLTTHQQGFQRIFMVFLPILWEAYRDGSLRPFREEPTFQNDVDFGQLPLVEGQEGPIPAPVVITGWVGWARIHGLVLLELVQRSEGLMRTPGEIYRHEAAAFMGNIGLELKQIPEQPKEQPGTPTSKKTSPQTKDDLHVIFGSGPLGLAVMTELLRHGKQVRMINRSGKAVFPEGVEWMAGDAFQVEFTRKACQNAAVVYQCAQPANGIWLERFAALNAAILDGAAAKGAKFIYGDNLLAYGAVDGPIHEGMANKPQTRKGQIRARVSEAVLTAHRSGRVRAAIGRASDFFGPNVLNSNLGERSFVPLLKGKTVEVIGDEEIPHTFTYIEDFGKALVVLGERDEALGQIWHVPNPPALTQRQLMEIIFREAGLTLKIHCTRRGILTIYGFVSADSREKVEILYQFEKPFIVDSSKFEKTFRIPATPLPEAVRRTINWYRENLK